MPRGLPIARKRQHLRTWLPAMSHHWGPRWPPLLPSWWSLRCPHGAPWHCLCHATPLEDLHRITLPFCTTVSPSINGQNECLDFITGMLGAWRRAMCVNVPGRCLPGWGVYKASAEPGCGYLETLWSKSDDDRRSMAPRSGRTWEVCSAIEENHRNSITVKILSLDLTAGNNRLLRIYSNKAWS